MKHTVVMSQGWPEVFSVSARHMKGFCFLLQTENKPALMALCNKKLNISIVHFHGMQATEIHRMDMENKLIVAEKVSFSIF